MHPVPFVQWATVDEFLHPDGLDPGISSFRYSGTGVAASVLLWKASANHLEMVDDTWISMDGGGVIQ